MAVFYKTNPQAEFLRTAFNWIANNLDINYPANPLSTSSFLANEEALCQASKLLKAFGTGIEDVKSVVKMERGKKDKAYLEGRYGGMPENTTKVFPYSVFRKQYGLLKHHFHHH